MHRAVLVQRSANFYTVRTSRRSAPPAPNLGGALPGPHDAGIEWIIRRGTSPSSRAGVASPRIGGRGAESRHCQPSGYLRRPALGGKEKTKLLGTSNSLPTTVDFELCVDAEGVAFDGGGRYDQRVGYFFIGHPFCQQ